MNYKEHCPDCNKLVDAELTNFNATFRVWACLECGKSWKKHLQEERQGDWGDYHDAMSGRF